MTLNYYLNCVALGVLAFVLKVTGSEECGRNYYLGTLSCMRGHYCCSPAKATCCPDGTICIQDDKACLHVAVIIVPVVGFVGIIVAVALCCYCCKRRSTAQGGVVLQPAPCAQPQQHQQMLLQNVRT